jgi:hypothetical protein
MGILKNKEQIYDFTAIYPTAKPHKTLSFAIFYSPTNQYVCDKYLRFTFMGCMSAPYVSLLGGG